MRELTQAEVDQVSGGIGVVLAGIGVATAIIANAGSISDFFGGLYDGISEAVNGH